MRHASILTALLAVLGVFAVAATPSAAQEATPPPGSDLPALEDCKIAPVSPEEFVARLTAPAGATMTAGDEAPPAGGQVMVASEDEFPSGEPVDDETVRAVTEVVREAVACLNGSDFLRIAALSTPGLLRGLLGAEDVTVEEAALFAAQLAAPPTPRPEELRSAILDLRDGRRFTDGRVGVVVVADAPGDEEAPATSLIILVNSEQRWIIDTILQVDPTATPSSAG